MARRKYRGVSIGTVLMLCITVMVILGFATVLPRLSGDKDVTIDTDKVLQALSLGDHLPELKLGDIPINFVNAKTSIPTAAPTATPAQATAAAPVVFATLAPTAVPTAAPTATPVPGGRFTATFGGSVIINNDLRQEHYFSEAKKYDFYDVMMLLADALSADMTMVTLENSIYPDAKLSEINTTADVLPMLSRVGVNTVAVGYRNAYDHGLEGLASTIAAVQGSGMKVLGAYGDTQTAQSDTHIVELGGVKVAMLHFTDVLTDKGKKAVKKDGNDFAVPVDAVSDGAGEVLAAVAKARENGAQVVIVSLSWSAASGKSTATKKQVAYAQQLADAGVDVIIGAGSRVVQQVTWLTGNLADGTTKQTLCAYSLGSLFNGSRTNANVAGMLLHLDITFDGQKVIFNQVGYTPTYIWRYKQDGRYYYRVVASHQAAPDGMSESQIDSMERAFTNVKKYLGEDSPLVLR